MAQRLGGFAARLMRTGARAAALGTAAVVAQQNAAQRAQTAYCEESGVKTAAARTRIHRGKVFPVWSMQQVQAECSDERVLVTYEDGVFDVTSFVSHHPGGPLIMMANGGPLESMWMTYRVHFKRSVYDTLERYRIGVLQESDRTVFDELEDPFCNEPLRHPGLVVLRQKPFDAETPKHVLAQSFYTRNNVFYVRNHFPVPLVEDASEHEIEINVPVELGGSGEDKTLKLGDLLSTHRNHALDSALFCTGFRAWEMTKDPYDAKGGQMGNARWEGVRLRDVLMACGLDEEKVFADPAPFSESGAKAKAPPSSYHVHLTGLDGYSVSIPLEVACRIDHDVLIATQMNGRQLPRDHGFPARVLVPSLVGARSVKWISEISISKGQSTSPFHRNIYRIWPSDVHTHEQVPEQVDNMVPAARETPSVESAPINSLILTPGTGQVRTLPARSPWRPQRCVSAPRAADRWSISRRETPLSSRARRSARRARRSRRWRSSSTARGARTTWSSRATARHTGVTGRGRRGRRRSRARTWWPTLTAR